MSTLELGDCGDSALRVVAKGGDHEERWRLVHLVAAWIDRARLPGVLNSVPTYDSVLIEFDGLVTSHAMLRSELSRAALSFDTTKPLRMHVREFRVPVVYGGEYGPDLELVAEQVGVSAEEIVQMHHGTEYTIRCLGAPGGSPMVDGPPFPRPVPRLADPRVSVPQGAVSVAGRQATITPAVAPGGWPLIGRTPLKLLQLDREPLVPYVPGDRLTFYPITADQWADFAGMSMVAVDE